MREPLLQIEKRLQSSHCEAELVEDSCLANAQRAPLSTDAPKQS